MTKTLLLSDELADRSIRWAVPAVRILLVEAAVLFLLFWRDAHSLIYSSIPQLRPLDAMGPGAGAASSVLLLTLPFVLLLVLVGFALTPILRRTSATFLLLLFLPIAALAILALPVSEIPLMIAAVTGTLIHLLHRAVT